MWSIFKKFLFAYLATNILGGIALAWLALHPFSDPVSTLQTERQRVVCQRHSVQLEEASVSASDGAILRGWLLKPANPNGDIVLLLHGVKGNRVDMMPYANFLTDHNYTVLATDARAHGGSGGPIATYGLLEKNDIHVWLTQVADPIHPRCIFALGESMGAAQLLQSLPGETRFCAVAAESPFATFREVSYDRIGRPIHVGPWLGRTVFRLAIETGFFCTRWFYHVDMDQVAPIKSVQQTQIPIFLIHGMKDRNIPPRHSEQLQARNPSIVLWEVPNAVHIAAFRVAPAEFQKKILAWFASHDKPPEVYRAE